MAIESLGEALAYFKNILPNYKLEGYNRIGQLISFNNEKYFVMFKKEYYKSFSSHFPTIKKSDGSSYGYGQIMTYDVLKECVNVYKTDWIVFISPDNKVYKTPASLYLQFVVTNKTFVPHLKGEVAIPLSFFINMQSPQKPSQNSLTGYIK